MSETPESSGKADAEDTGVSMVEILEEEERLEADANAVLGDSDDKNCTYPRVTFSFLILQVYLKNKFVISLLVMVCQQGEQNYFKRSVEQNENTAAPSRRATENKVLISTGRFFQIGIL